MQTKSLLFFLPLTVEAAGIAARAEHKSSWFPLAAPAVNITNTTVANVTANVTASVTANVTANTTVKISEPTMPAVQYHQITTTGYFGHTLSKLISKIKNSANAISLPIFVPVSGRLNRLTHHPKDIYTHRYSVNASKPLVTRHLNASSRQSAHDNNTVYADTYPYQQVARQRIGVAQRLPSAQLRHQKRDVKLSHKPRDGAIALWSQRNFNGHAQIYGRTLGACDTVEVMTDQRLGVGKSASMRWENSCCLLYTGRGCHGQSLMVSSNVPSLAPYDFDHRVKSVFCMDQDACKAYYAEEKWRGE